MLLGRPGGFDGLAEGVRGQVLVEEARGRMPDAGCSTWQPDKH